MSYTNKQKEKEYQQKYQKDYWRLYIKKNKRKRDFLTLKNCLYCQKSFQPKNDQQKFCKTSHKNMFHFKFNPETSENTKNYYKNYYMKKRYGISIKQYQKLFNFQGGVCAICGGKETRKNKYIGIAKLSIDHDHKTHKIRGLLCNKCNACLGLIDDNKEILQKMIKYLENNE